MKIVVNRECGRFKMSYKAASLYLETIGKDCYPYRYSTELGAYILLEEDEALPSLALYEIYSTKWFGWKVDKIPNEHCFRGSLINRTDEILINIVETLGEEASGACSLLEVVEIPDDVDWFIRDHNGYETIYETHRTW